MNEKGQAKLARIGWLGALFVCFAIPSLTQETSPPSSSSGQTAAPAPTPPVTLIPRSHEERESRYRAEHHIILNVLVTDATGRPVTGLKQEDFTLLDDLHSQEIATFRQVKGAIGPAPAHVILMLDMLNNTSRSIAAERKEIERFLAQSQGPFDYPTSIAVLSASGARAGHFSRDREAVAGEFRTLANDAHAFECADEGSDSSEDLEAVIVGHAAPSSIGKNSGSARAASCLNRRFQLSVSELNKLARKEVDSPGRAILIWIGPGWPLLTGHEFSPDTAAIRQNLFPYLVDLSTELREAQVTLDAVSSPDLFRRDELRTDHDNVFFDGVPSEDEVTASSLGLQVLAHQSGGQILTEGKDLAGEIAKCIADAELYYALSFDSGPAAKPGEFHSLRISVNKPGLTARTNTAYYAQP